MIGWVNREKSKPVENLPRQKHLIRRAILEKNFSRSSLQYMAEPVVALGKGGTLCKLNGGPSSLHTTLP